MMMPMMLNRLDDAKEKADDERFLTWEGSQNKKNRKKEFFNFIEMRQVQATGMAQMPVFPAVLCQVSFRWLVVVSIAQFVAISW
jgi:hypothetical protein